MAPANRHRRASGPPDAGGWRSCCNSSCPAESAHGLPAGMIFRAIVAEPGLYAVVFLDICMAGTTMASRPPADCGRPTRRWPTVFAPSPEYVWGCLPVHPFDYLLKPYQEEKLSILPLSCGGRFVVRSRTEIRIARQSIQLPPRKVLYAIAWNHYVLYHHRGWRVPRHVQFCAHREEKLTALENFMSCNRGVIINMDKVLRFGEYSHRDLDGTRSSRYGRRINAPACPLTQYQSPPHAAELH